MKKIILNLLLVINLNAVDTHGSLTKFWETLDWDSFWNSFSFSFMGCDCKPKFLVDWCEAFFCDFLPAIQEQHLEPFANFSASPNPLTFVGLNTDSTDHIMGPKKGVTRKNSLQKEIDTASFQQINMLPFPIASIISFFDPTNTICLSTDAIDTTYISDIDPLYHNDGLNNFWTLIKSPSRFLELLVPIWEWRCLVDCLSETINVPLDAMWSCNGCSGGLGSQDTGWQKNIEPMQNAEMLAYRLIHNFHERMKYMDISSDACESITSLTIKKSQYKISLGSAGQKPHYFGKIRFLTYDGKDSIKAKDEYSFFIWKKRKFCGLWERLCYD